MDEKIFVKMIYKRYILVDRKQIREFIQCLEYIYLL